MYWHQKSSVGSNLCLLKSVGAVGWRPTGFEDGSIGINYSSVGSNLCLLNSVGAVGWQPTGFEASVLASKEPCRAPRLATYSREGL